MTKLVNQIYSKADAGTYFYVCIWVLKFSRHFFVSCRTVSEGSAAFLAELICLVVGGKCAVHVPLMLFYGH